MRISQHHYAMDFYNLAMPWFVVAQRFRQNEVTKKMLQNNSCRKWFGPAVESIILSNFNILCFAFRRILQSQPLSWRVILFASMLAMNEEVLFGTPRMEASMSSELPSIFFSDKLHTKLPSKKMYVCYNKGVRLGGRTKEGVSRVFKRSTWQCKETIAFEIFDERSILGRPMGFHFSFFKWTFISFDF